MLRRSQLVVGAREVASAGLTVVKAFTGRDCGTGYACLDPSGGGYHVIADA